MKFKFKYNTGVEAKDYSELKKRKDIKPLEVLIQKMYDMSEVIKNEMRFLLIKEG